MKKYEVTIDFPSGEDGRIQLDCHEDEMENKWRKLGMIISGAETDENTIIKFHREGGFIIKRDAPVTAYQFLNPMLIEKITIIEITQDYNIYRRRNRQ